MKKILLYSGGMDSWLISQIWKPDLKIYIDMHTRYSNTERKKITENEKDVQVIDFSLGQWEREDAIIPLRNLYLVMVACNITGGEDVEICLGATAGDRVLDKSEGFKDRANDLLNYLYQPQHWLPQGKKVNINIDFKSKTKTELVKMYIEQGGNIKDAFSRSFSCYNPINGAECWECKPCFRKFVAFALNGMEFDENTVSKAINYIKREIYPEIQKGTYGRAEEEKEIKEVLKKYEKYIRNNSI